MKRARGRRRRGRRAAAQLSPGRDRLRDRRRLRGAAAAARLSRRHRAVRRRAAGRVGPAAHGARMGGAGRDRARHHGRRRYFVFERYLLVLLPRGAGRASRCSSCSAPASSTSCSGNICCRCSPARFVGVIGGSLPGVTITMTVIVVLPFTFGLDPLQGLAAMTGVYVGGSTGGLITALPARHSRHAVVDRHHVRRLPDGAQRRAGPRDLARRLGVVLRRPARRRVPGVR